MTVDELTEDREAALTIMATNLLADVVRELSCLIPPEHLPTFCEVLVRHARNKLQHAYRIGAVDALEFAVKAS